MIKKYILFLLLLFSSKFLFATTNVDTANITKQLKLHLFSELAFGLLSPDALRNYLEQDLKVNFLESKGFENIIFMKIGVQVLAYDTIGEKNFFYSTPPCLKTEECVFIYAFNIQKEQFYRLKGTQCNDFKQLYQTLMNWQYWKLPKKLNKKTIRKFIQYFWVEELDMKCLLFSLKGKKGKCLEPFSFPIITH